MPRTLKEKLTGADVAEILLDGQWHTLAEVKSRLEYSVPDWYIMRLPSKTPHTCWEAAVHSCIGRLVTGLIRYGQAERIDFKGNPVVRAQRITYKVKLTAKGLRHYRRLFGYKEGPVSKKLTDAQVDEIRDAHRAGLTHDQLATKFGIGLWAVRTALGWRPGKFRIKKLTAQQVEEVKRTYKRRSPEFNRSALAAKYGVSTFLIGRIIHGRYTP